MSAETSNAGILRYSTLGRSAKPIKRKPRKRRAPGVGCQVKGGKVCRRNAYTVVGERRMCAKHAADALFSQAIRESLGGRCWVIEFGGSACSVDLQCAHLISRRYGAIRWDEANARPLCGAHHLYFTHHPLEWEEFCRSLGVDWDGLRWRALNEPPMDPEEVVARYR